MKTIYIYEADIFISLKRALILTARGPPVKTNRSRNYVIFRFGRGEYRFIASLIRRISAAGALQPSRRISAAMSMFISIFAGVTEER